MSKFRLILVFTVAVLAAVASIALALQVGEHAPQFALGDQFGRQWKLSDLEGKVVVVVAATRESGRAMGPWVDNLKDRYGSKIELLGLMDLRGIPGIGRGIAKSRIRKETQDPLMLDFKGSMAKAYLVSDRHPTVIVIDRKGAVLAIQGSEWTKDTFDVVTGAIDKGLKESPVS